MREAGDGQIAIVEGKFFWINHAYEYQYRRLFNKYNRLMEEQKYVLHKMW